MNCKTLNVCQEFFRNPDYNPRTLRRIKREAQKYKELVKECEEPEDPFKKFLKERGEQLEENEPIQDNLVTIGENLYDVDEFYDYVLNSLRTSSPILDPSDSSRLVPAHELNKIFEMKGIHMYPSGVQLNHVDDTQNLYHYFVTIEEPGNVTRIVDLGYVPSDIVEQDTLSEFNTSDAHAQLVYKLWDQNRILDDRLGSVVIQIGKPRKFWLGPGSRGARINKFLDLMSSMRN